MEQSEQTCNNGIILSKKQCRILDLAEKAHHQNAFEARTVAYMPRGFIQANLPYRDPGRPLWNKQNGTFSLSIKAGEAMDGAPDFGLPYGSIPRFLICWMTTQAVKKKERTLPLENLRDLLRQLNLKPTGGARGDITRLREQMDRLFGAKIFLLYTNSEPGTSQCFEMIENPNSLSHISGGKFNIILTQEFYDHAVNRPVPVDLRILHALSRSPFAMDIYCWLTYRLSYLRSDTKIKWSDLQAQFGAEYKELKSFKSRFIAQLESVKICYTDAKVFPTREGLLLKPSRPHIPKRLIP